MLVVLSSSQMKIYVTPETVKFVADPNTANHSTPTHTYACSMKIFNNFWFISLWGQTKDIHTHTHARIFVLNENDKFQQFSDSFNLAKEWKILIVKISKCIKIHIRKRELKRTLCSTSPGARIQWCVSPSPPQWITLTIGNFEALMMAKHICFRNSCTWWWWLKVGRWSLVMTNGRRRKRLMVPRWNGPVRCDTRHIRWEETLAARMLKSRGFFSGPFLKPRGRFKCSENRRLDNGSVFPHNSR